MMRLRAGTKSGLSAASSPGRWNWSAPQSGSAFPAGALQVYVSEAALQAFDGLDPAEIFASRMLN